MAKIVNHEERKREILTKAIRLIGERGFSQVGYQQIADVCGLTRTTLYSYFKDKREIFDNGIALLVKVIGEDFQDTMHRNLNLSASAKLTEISRKGLEAMMQYPPLLGNIMEYLQDKHRQGISLDRRILRHTVSLRRMLKSLLKEGIQNGEFQPVNLNDGMDLLYALFESAALRLIIQDKPDRQELMKPFLTAINCLKRDRN